jgi:hypothetical protein
VKYTVPDTEFAPIKEETLEDEEYGKHQLKQRRISRTTSPMTSFRR